MSSFLEMIELGEPWPNALRIVVAEAIVREKSREPIRVAPGLKIEDSAPITVGPDSRVWEIFWSNYVSYSVGNESYATPENGDEAEHNCDDAGIGSEFFFELRSSEFLKFFRSVTIAEAVFSKQMRHWRVGCLNHVVDVLSWADPEIKALTGYSLPEFDLDRPPH